MADAVNTKWIYPPNWDLEEYNPPNGGYKKVTVQFSCISDGTGESDVHKLDISKLHTVLGKECKRTVVDQIWYNIRGFTSVFLEWDRAPQTEIHTFSGESSGHFDFRPHGGLVDPSDGIDDGTGDILLTTAGADSGDSYSITLEVRLKPAQRPESW